ncbi:hypothetical protein PIECOFPK_00759 [Mycovorax composti]|mgnify:CR=1 FL=1|jgi:Uncharacterized conserved protein|uniref:DUF1330 domain-containing protein n=2 Tax=Chitinophagaceae TaxID=563835 RepID=A0ABZ2EHR5_9BACT
MIITQLIYIKPGAETLFDQFEAIAIPLIAKHNGKLLLRIRPDKTSILESNIPAPYEVHMVEFPSEHDFESFMQDPERQKHLSLKEQAIQSAVLIKGATL